MKNILMLSTALVFAFPLFAHASEKASMAMDIAGMTTGQDCKMVETTTFTANFNNVNIEIGNAKTYMDEQIAAIESIGKELSIEKFELQSSSMNVYSNSYNTGCGQTTAPAQYQLNGSVTYNLNDAAKAAALAKKLEAKSYNLNLNSSAYKQCQ